nr:hypothetical protein [Tanacetum cinerariifolium]
MASAVICLATGRKFNFSKYIFDSLVRNVDSSSKFYMHPRFLQLMINAQIADLSSYTTKYTSLALTQKVFTNMRRDGKGFYGVDTPLFDGMLVPQQVHVNIDAAGEDVNATKPTSPTPTTTPPPQELIPSSSHIATTPPLSPHQSPSAQPSLPPQQQTSPPSQTTNSSMDLLNTLLETWGIIAEIDANEDVTLEEVDAEEDAEVAKKDVDAQGRLKDPQAKFIIHTILQCMSAKRIAWNEFSSSMASAVICLATGRKFNFSKYIFDSLVRNVDSSSKFYMHPRFLQLMINAQIADLSFYTTKYTSLALTQKVFTNMRRDGKGFYRVDTPLFDGMLVPQQVHVNIDAAREDVNAVKPTSPTPTTTPPPQELIPSSSHIATTPPLSPHQSPSAQPSSPLQQQTSPPSQTTNISMDLLNILLETCTTLTRRVENLVQDKIAQDLEIIKLKQRVKALEGFIQTGGIIAEIDANEDVTLEEVDAEKDVEVAKKDVDAQGRLKDPQAKVYQT